MIASVQIVLGLS